MKICDRGETKSNRLTLIFIRSVQEKPKSKRSCKLRQLTREREKLGSFILVKALAIEDTQAYAGMMRMKHKQSQLNFLELHISKQTTTLGRRISSADRLCFFSRAHWTIFGFNRHLIELSEKIVSNK